MGDLRHHGPVRESSDERRRTGGVAEQATPAPPVTGPYLLSRRPLYRPGRPGTYRRGLAALARPGGRLAAGGALPDRVHPYARQRRRARAGTPIPRRRAGPGARGRAVSGAGRIRAADALLSGLASVAAIFGI